MKNMVPIHRGVLHVSPVGAIVGLLLFLLPVSSCASSSRNSASIGSGQGSVPFGESACSPDGKRRACEVKPQGHGRIGIYLLKPNKLEKVIDTPQHPDGDFANDLKGLAWSPDSKQLAVMYHHGGGGHISIVSVATGKETKRLSLNEFYHYIEYSSDGRKIMADGQTLQIGR